MDKRIENKQALASLLHSRAQRAQRAYPLFDKETAKIALGFCLLAIGILYCLSEIALEVAI